MLQYSIENSTSEYVGYKADASHPITPIGRERTVRMTSLPSYFESSYRG